MTLSLIIPEDTSNYILENYMDPSPIVSPFPDISSTFDQTLYNLITTRKKDNKNKNEHPPDLFLDVDECLGSFGAYSIICQIYLQFSKTYPSIHTGIEHLSKGAFRPHLKQFFEMISHLKEQKKIRHVNLFTSNKCYELISHLKDCIEIFTKVPKGTIDHIFNPGNIDNVAFRNGRLIKDLNCGLGINEKCDNCIMIDDTPENIIQKPNVIPIKPYKYYVYDKEIFQDASWWNEIEAIQFTIDPRKCSRTSKTFSTLQSLEYDKIVYGNTPCDFNDNQLQLMTDCLFLLFDF